MDYEKKYKEALERAKKFIEANPLVQNLNTWIKETFPELKESEEEKIRKRISQALHGDVLDFDEIIQADAWLEKQGNNINCIYDKELSELLHIVICRYINDPNISYPERENVSKKILPYVELLERQGEQKSIWHNEDEEPKRGNLILLIMQSGTPIVAKIIEPNHTFNHGERWAYIDDLLEKQGEQKPADKVEPKCEESKTKIFDAPTPFEDKLYVFVAACEFLAIPSKIEFILEHSQEILDAAREQIGKEQKPAWSEDDERKIQDCIDAVSRVNFFKVYYQNELVGWLKSLKTKVQPKQEWSEKDEEELEIAIDTLKESGRYDSARWVQSLKQRIGG